MSITDKTITFGIPMIAPVGWVEFAERNPDQAELSIGIVQDSDDVMNLLCDINDDVNEKISPKLDAPGQDWNIWPRSRYGDCTDYTVTKRAELMSKGLPSSSLLIAEVVTPEEEPHAILVVRTVGGDYVLDNRDPMVYPLERSRVLVREDADSGESQLLEVGGRMTHEAKWIA